MMYHILCVSEQVTGMRIAALAPGVSFVISDNNLFLCKSKSREYDKVMKGVKVYGKASGQYINFEKLSILFGKEFRGL